MQTLEVRYNERGPPNERMLNENALIKGKQIHNSILRSPGILENQ